MFRFLGCVFTRRQLQHIKSEEYIANLDTREPSVNGFNVENLQCQVSINPDDSFQSLHLKVAPDDPNQWQSDYLLFIQNFFDAKVSLFYYLLRTVSHLQFEIFVVFPL